MPDNGAKTHRDHTWSFHCHLPVVFFVHKMVSCSECYQVSIIGWCGDRNRSCAAHICVAELISQQLEFICSKTVIIPQNMIVWGTAGTLRRRKQRFTYLALPNDHQFLSSERARLSCLNSSKTAAKKMHFYSRPWMCLKIYKPNMLYLIILL